MEGQLPKERVQVKQGAAQVQQVFRLRGKVETVVAGLKVTEGSLRSATSGSEFIYRLSRQSGLLVADGLKVSSLKRGKEAATEVTLGAECGISFEGHSDIVENDLIECYKVEWNPRKLVLV